MDEKLNPTGKSYQTQTTDDAGTFRINNQIDSRYVEIIATGYYFNEISGKVSSSTLTLRSLSDLTESGKTNVNLLTTLESDRIRNLVTVSGMTIQKAREQAEKELYTIFNIPNSVSTTEGFDKMDITKDGETNAILLAISAILQGERSEGELSELISKIAAEINDNGRIDSSNILKQIIEGGLSVNAENVRSNLENRYDYLSISDYRIPPFEDYLDTNGNGIIDKLDSWLILSDKDISIPDEGGIFEVELGHNVDYDITIDCNGPQWIHDNNTTRAYLESSKLTFYADENETFDTRYARITIKERNGSNEEHINIAQKQKDALTVTSDKIEIGKEGGRFEIEVKANINFSVEIPAEYREWLSESPKSKGLESTKLSFNVEKSEEADVREGKIIIKSGSLSETITIYQSGERTIVLNQKEYVLSKDEHTIYITVSSNVEYEILLPTEDWINEVPLTKGMSTCTHKFKISENTTHDNRQAEIIVRDKSSSLEERVSIFQAQKDAIIIAKDTYDFDNRGGKLSVTVKSNIDLLVDISKDSKSWISMLPETKALSEHTLNFLIGENQGYDNRAGEIIIHDQQNNLSKTIHIHQGQKNIIILSQDRYEMDETGGTISLVIKSNVDYTVNIQCDGQWLHLLPQTRSLTSETIDFTVDPNSTHDNREATITITDAVNNIKESVTVHQSQKNAIVIGTDEYEVPYLGGEVFINVKSNVSYNVIIDETIDWISQLPETRGLAESTAVLQVARNQSYKARSGNVRFQNTETGIGQTITIHQHPSEETVTIHIENAGTLEGQISKADLNQIIDLKLTGNMNNTDISMFTLDSKLKKLDLSEVSFPDNTFNGFNNLKQLKEVHLPPTLKSMKDGKGIFDGCTSLTTVDFGENPQIEVIGGSIYWGFNDMMQSEVKLRGAFSNCPELKSITIPESVTAIEPGAFALSGIESIIFDKNCRIEEFAPVDLPTPGSTGRIYFGVFAGCENLRTIDIPSSVLFIEECAFKGWTGLEELIIPESVKYIMTGGLFSECKNLEYVSLPKSATTIGDYMFNECTNLKSFDFAAGYTSIGDGAFSGCANLRTINLDNVTKIGDAAFKGCGITGIRIPDFMTEIPYGLFKGCDKLESIDFNKAEIIGRDSFEECHALEKITIPQNVKEVGSGAFHSCKNLTEVYIKSDSLHFSGVNVFTKGVNSSNGYIMPEGYKPLELFHIGNSTKSITSSVPVGSAGLFDMDFNNFVFEAGSQCEEFGLCSYLSLSHINLPGSVKKLSDRAFYACKNLSRIEELLTGIEIIGEYAFSKAGIKTIDIPEGVRIIHSGAFRECEDLRAFSLPSSLTELGSYTFAYNPKLVTSTLNGTDLTLNGEVFYDCPYITKTIIGKDVKSLMVKKPLTEAPVEFEAGTQIEFISGHVFNKDITSVNLPSTLKTIGTSVFSQCKQIKEIIIPYGVTSIGDFTFDECTLLEKIALPESLESIGKYAFRLCTSLKSITIPAKVHTIGEKAFYDCSIENMEIQGTPVFKTNVSSNKITLTAKGEIPLDFYKSIYAQEFILSEGIMSIPDGAFKGKMLKSITIPTTVTSVGAEAFYGCDNLTEIAMESVTSVGAKAFYACDNLFSISLPEATAIGEYAFYKNISLSDIQLPKCRNLGEYSFYGCTSLTALELPMAETIGQSTFRECSSLSELSFPTAKAIGDMAFYKCTSLASLCIPNATTIGDYFIQDCNKLTEIELNGNDITLSQSAFYASYLKSLTIGDTTTSFVCGSALPTTLESLKTSPNSKLERICFNQPTGSLSTAVYALKSIDLPTVTEIGECSFSNCSQLSTVNLPSVKVIGANAFTRCSSLTTVDLPNVESIKENGFYQCEALSSISFPKLKSLGRYSMWNCPIVELDLPASTQIISDRAFNSTALTNVTCRATSVPTCYSMSFPSCKTLKVPAESIEAYKAHSYWKKFESILAIE